MLLDFSARHSGLLLLVAFVSAGLWALDDYGVSTDEGVQRNIAISMIGYAFGDLDALLPDKDKFYGVVFEVPLLLAERALGLEDSRDIFLMRHLIAHLFFLAGGFFCYLLAYRLFENRLLAVAAMLLFLLHPRLYAHSFFNTKDIPFLSMFMVCLYLVHRAFDRGAVWRFLILGVGVGLLINLRVMGATLFAAVLAMQFLDLFHAHGDGGRRRVSAGMAVFVLSSLLTVYVSMPYLWSDPIGSGMEWFSTFSQYPNSVAQLFRGDVFRSVDVHPPEYVPVWFSISTSPLALASGVAGIAVVLCRGAVGFGDVFRSTRLRFGFLLVGCFVLPIFAVVVLSSNVYNGWRQMYFIYAPFCLLAVFGLHWLVSSARGRRVRFAVYGAFVAGVAAVVASMASIHPHQHVYFNFMVDRATPEHLRHRYDMDYWGASSYEALEFLVELRPSSDVSVRLPNRYIGGLNRALLPSSDRSRMSMNDGAVDFLVTNYRDGWSSGGVLRDVPGSTVYSLNIYGSAVLAVADLSDVDDEFVDEYMETHRRMTSDGERLIRGEFDVYIDGYDLVYVRDDCGASDVELEFFLHMDSSVSDVAVPEADDRLRADRFNFDFYHHGIVLDGICVAVVPVPRMSFSRLTTGQWDGNDNAWAGVYLAAASEARHAFQAFRQSNDSEPVVRSVFDVYIDVGRLIYVNERCDAGDHDVKFFLHVRPADVADLPEERKDSGFDNLDFDLLEHGGEWDGACFAVVELPEYEIASVYTGQYTTEGHMWSEEYSVAASSALIAFQELSDDGVESVVRSVFDVYIDDGRLIYAKSSCTDEERETRFFLHVRPVDMADLPKERIETGFDNLDFNLWERGGESAGDCFAVVDLPEYEISSISTGQYTLDGRVWSMELVIGDE